MNLQKIMPKHGKVIIIDDKYEEVKILMNLCAKNGWPYLYYNYEDTVNNGIEQKVDNVRIAFVDICLEEGATDSKNILSTLASMIEKTISKSNGIYCLILWTNDYAFVDQAKKYLLENLSNDDTTTPYFIIGMDKKEFTEKELKHLEEQLLKILDEHSMYGFLCEWENLATKSIGAIVADLSYKDEFEFDDESIETLFAVLARSENSLVNNKEDVIKSTLYTLGDLINSKYLDCVNEKNCNELTNYLKMSYDNKVKFESSSIPDRRRALINTMFNLCTSEDGSDHVPGKVYKINEGGPIDVELIRKMIIKNLESNEILVKDNEKQISIPFEIVPVQIDITPSCDYAQNKVNLLRTVLGFMIIFERFEDDNKINVSYLKKMNKIVQDNTYKTPEFLIKDKISVFAINPKLVSLEQVNFGEKLEYITRFNNELLCEIRKECSNDLSRIGIVRI